MTVHYIDDSRYANWVLGATHPTQGRRYTNATAMLQHAAATSGLDIVNVPSRQATRAELEVVHTPEYISRVLDSHTSGAWDGTDPVLAELSTLLFGGTMVAVEHVLNGALNVVHLPGAKHHAMAEYASGFCVFADFAAAATLLTSVHNKRVAILDIDVHHGDGTEALLRNNSDALTFSVHQDGIFPWTGHEIEDDHVQRVYNRPLQSGAGDTELRAAVSDFVDVCQEFKPDIIMIAAGADGHAQDSLGQLLYSTEGFHAAVELVRQSFQELPIILGGAGGYRPDDYTPAMWVSAICALAGRAAPDEAALMQVTGVEVALP